MTYYDAYPDTLLYDSTDLQSLDGVAFTDISGLLAPATRRGGPDVIPARRGQLGANNLPIDAYNFSVPFLVDADTHAEMLERLFALADVLVLPDATADMVRRLDNGAGYDEATAWGQFVGFANMDLSKVHLATGELQFINLDGGWSADSGVTWLSL